MTPDPAPLREAIARVIMRQAGFNYDGDSLVSAANTSARAAKWLADADAILAALPTDAPEGSEWHRSDSHNQTMLYTLMEDGWRKGEPRLVNDVTVTVQRSNPSTTDIEPIARAIHGFLSREALPTDAVQPVGGVSAEEHRQRGVKLIGMTEWAGAHLCRAERAEEERDALLRAIGFKPGPMGDARDVILSDAEALRPAMVKARRAQRDAEGDAMLLECFIAEGRLEPLLVKVWKRAKAAEKALALYATAPTAGSGWVMVPREATEAMIDAWTKAVGDGIFGLNGDAIKPHAVYMRDAYTAMITAAPTVGSE